MRIDRARWANPEQSAVIVNDALIVPVEDGELSGHLRDWLAAGGRPEPFHDHNDARRVRILEIKAEARRRILDLVPGTTLDNRHEKQINALMQATLRLYDAVELLANGNAAGARAIVQELAPVADRARKIVAIRRHSDRFEDLVMNSPANPVTWDVDGVEMWP